MRMGPERGSPGGKRPARGWWHLVGPRAATLPWAPCSLAWGRGGGGCRGRNDAPRARARRDWGAGRAQGPVPGEGHLVVACWWPKQGGAASQAVEGCRWAPCRVSGRRAARGTGLEGLAPSSSPCHWGWHEGEAACPGGAQLGAAPCALGASRAAGAERTGMGTSAGCRCGKLSARPAHVNGTRVRPQRRCPDPRWSPESAGTSPRPRCSITPGWRFGRAPQPGRGAGSSWGTPSLAGGLPASALPRDAAPYRGSQPALGGGIGVGAARLGVSGRWGAGSAALLPGRWSPRGAVTLR